MVSNGYWCIRQGARYFFPQSNTNVAPVSNTNNRAFYASTMAHLGTIAITNSKTVAANTSGCCTTQTLEGCPMAYSETSSAIS